ncbi:hypothetical protein [Clostridium magnum]|uniref:Uncharacterized protein n=1 Tax=Clostridium magnum DSM 2767 TaxID=1121326 RepID=A0A162QG19_9CLOT|nr:hypothetical protein [Clostridium magnum]KZL88497.1 hypothetical protein CLMAG_61520 [Clostridium magnum DSM 2767]SHJ11825.1 hypothetical protein SAMN02745944_05372 [Clostridium magnum DSM 2767]
MIIKSLEGQVFNVVVDELYLKPTYRDDSVCSWTICSNEKNQELVLGVYSKKRIAGQMLHILELCANKLIETSLISEEQLCQDIYFQAMERLNKAKIAYMRGEVK